MNSSCKACLVGAIVLACGAAFPAAAVAQLQPQPELLKRLWPFGRLDQRPIPLLPPESEPSDDVPEKRRPLVAPFVPPTIDINTCSLAELQNLPGVDASLGARILAGRPYRNYQDLERDGVPLSVVQRLQGKISFGRRSD